MAIRMFWARRKASPQAAVDRMHYVVWDFLKMFTAAVLCGLAVSVVAASLTLLLSQPAEAITPKAVQEDVQEPTHGALIVGHGCEGMTIDAVERDWHVRIDGRAIEVRVMQTWVLPQDVEGPAVFQVRLPRQARLKSLSAITQDREWGGRTINLTDYERLSAAEYRKLTRNHLLVVQSANAHITSSPMMDLHAGEVVLVQYSYTVHAQSAQGVERFELPLQGRDPDETLDEYAADYGGAIAPTRRPATAGSVWVEWTGRKPHRLVEIPRNSSLDRVENRIEGISWSSPALQPGESLRLSWAM
ncbi:MAG: hypothetical protein JNN20_01580 [Betaproteobacteria bacterium]|nr:hypothetical protein [Betaproteobacteria bacterium]